MELERLGRYVVERVLGRGAMGIVYLAKDPVIGRQVALKTLSMPTDPEEVEEFHQRFLREAQAAGILNHPGIVTVHDAGVDENTGLSYIAMEYIEGRSIKDLQASAYAFTFSEVARIGNAIAAALDYAHSKGVVHRDIKPANIIITTQGNVKITDFGVARLESSNLTATGQFIGTPNYMSPEQITGTELDGRSDLFSLGVVLFELLAGARPFVGSSLTEVSYKIVHGPRPIPSQARPGVPPAFNPIVLKLLEREPEKRYARGADAAKALDALRRVLTGAAAAPSSTVAPVRTEVAPAPAAEAATAPATAESLRSEGEASPTATSATVLEGDSPISIWRRPIELKWIAILLAAALAPPLLVISILALSIDDGPFLGPPPGEPERRHTVSQAQRQAAAALAAGRPEQVEALLAPVWDQAPYSQAARDLRRAAGEQQASQAQRRADEARANGLLEEGKALLGAGRFRDARQRFEAVTGLLPGDPLADLARQYAELADARVRSVPQTRTVIVRATPTPVPVRATAPAKATIDVYFNSPVNAGQLELELDGVAIGKLPFDFTQKGFLGLKKKGTGVVSNDYTVASGQHRLTIRLVDGEGRLLGEETFPSQLAPGNRYTLKVEMESETATPKFYLRGR